MRRPWRWMQGRERQTLDIEERLEHATGTIRVKSSAQEYQNI